ncbi:hypothetical protein K490DRAFT_35298 [Saccharata proteae CBS 121410]|uniref:Pre-mRNA-splicing factor 38B n=1 Tax=Saccharata proteae CBS 121410 TaxID=1314787 RepID=A0A9P4HZU1_9PEZI|nr:hypothetical protein K490DRAFT_35298 [Saccharata proteae CBS 121410]
MSGGNLEDDYVAELLKKDAKASSSRYTAVGLQAFLPKRPTGHAPKPNTRFLRNILRETDTHNAALLAKEAEESRLRLRALKNGEAGGGADQDKSSKKESREERFREGLQRPSKRRRVEEEDDERNSRRRRHRDRESDQHRSRRDTSSHREDRRERRKRRAYEEDDEKHRHRRVTHRSHHHRDDRDRHRSDSGPKMAESTDVRRSRSRRERSVSSSRSRSSSRTRSHRKPRRRPRSSGERKGPEEVLSKAASKRNELARSPSPASDSDPLEAIVGPAPPSPKPNVRSRGRGTFSSSAAIDAHFASNYDPSQDVHPNSDLEDDWDQALEALRDRQRWMQQGADRMKAAGFTDDEIKRWEKGGEKKEEDVRWSKNGEGREWDRGKVVDDDGHVNLRPDWGRLKGT